MRLVIRPEHRSEWELFERVFREAGAPDEVVVDIWNSPSNPVFHGIPLEEPRLRFAAQETMRVARVIGWPNAARLRL